MTIVIKVLLYKVNYYSKQYSIDNQITIEAERIGDQGQWLPAEDEYQGT